MMDMEIISVYDERKAYLPLLLLGDEQESMIDRYLDRGHMFVMEEAGRALAVIVVTDEGEGVLEIKNLAVSQDMQRCGRGRRMIRHVEEAFSGRFHTLLVGTGDSPLTVPFYEKCGFVRSHVIKDFFIDHYDHAIIEDGVQLCDMVYFRKSI